MIGEFSLLNKPVISLNNSNPGNYLIDIHHADELPNAIKSALTPTNGLKKAIKQYASELHPYMDGQSSLRILNAVEEILLNGKQAPRKLPKNIFRNLKQRKKLGYWQL